jgi:hypothetical protein
VNAFYTDACPWVSAVSLADAHVVKMITEAAQVLSTAILTRSPDTAGLYRPTHRAHPVTVQAAQDDAYASWVLAWGLAMASEYEDRFGRCHKARAMLLTCARHLPEVPPTPTRVPLAMPEEFKSDDPASSYRLYLRAKYAAWGARARWTKTQPPAWAPPTQRDDRAERWSVTTMATGSP